MNLSQRLEISYYKTIATINENHKVYLVQHQISNKIFVKKILDVYNIDVYKQLYEHPILGTSKIINYYEDNNQLLLIEEYISGIPLSEKIDNSEITDKDILCYMINLCNILESLHNLEFPIIHRDIKPSNIIINSCNQAMLLDFNAAKTYSADKREDTILLGTHGYAAPEQYGFGVSSPQTDIYSLGILLKEMLEASNSQSKKLKSIAEKCTKLIPKERYNCINDLKKSFIYLANQFPTQLLDTSYTFKISFSKFLPPGYRSHTPWKMFIASLFYLIIFKSCLCYKINTSSVLVIWLYRLTYLAMLLSIIFCSFNYLNIQRFLPLCQSKHKFIKYAGIITLNILIFLIVFLIIFFYEYFLY